MSVDYTTVGLVADTKRRGFLPAGSGLTTSDILKVLTGELRNYIPAFLKGIREEYLVTTANVTVTSSVVRIPVRAAGVALRSIGWLEADGNVTPLARTEPERVSGYGVTSNGRPSAYVFRGNNVVLVPAVTSGTIVVAYQQRPGELVLPTACARITANGGGGLLNASTPVGLPSTIIAGAVVDVVAGVPNFELHAIDAVISSVTSAVPTSIITLTSDASEVVDGDYLCLATETCVPQIPLECFDLLAQAAAVEIAQSTGSTRLPAVLAGLKALREQTAVILSPRSDGSARVVVSRSRVGRRGY